MPGKDDFTYDDGDDFPENDLSSAFSEGEHAIPEPEFEEDEPVDPAGGGGSRTRILLMLLLLVAAVGAGAYYFMGLGGTTPAVPTVSVPAAKEAPLPAQQAPASQVVEQATQTGAVAVPMPPPLEPADKPATTAADAATQESGTTAPSPTPAAAPEQALTVTQSVTGEAGQPEAREAAVVAQMTGEEKGSLKVAMAGAYTLDAGSYLVESNRDALVKKLRKLGYEPLITPIKSTVNMTRMRLGTFSAGEIDEALAFAKTIEPTAFSVPAGEQFVIYAGTFLQPSNVEALSARFLKEGIRVRNEPVEIEKTLSRVRFGSFASKAEADEAAREVASSGVKAVAVKSR